MEGELGSGDKTALLMKSGSGKRGRFYRRNSVNSLRNEFVSRLPDKVRSGVDAESPFRIDVSKTGGLTRGLSLSLSLCLPRFSLCGKWEMRLLSAFHFSCLVAKKLLVEERNFYLKLHYKTIGFLITFFWVIYLHFGREKAIKFLFFNR